jgi:hypothetical protein
MPVAEIIVMITHLGTYYGHHQSKKITGSFTYVLSDASYRRWWPSALLIK